MEAIQAHIDRIQQRLLEDDDVTAELRVNLVEDRTHFEQQLRQAAEREERREARREAAEERREAAEREERREAAERQERREAIEREERRRDGKYSFSLSLSLCLLSSLP